MAGISLAAAFIFSCGNESGDVPANNADNTCGGYSLNSSLNFCYAEQIFAKCNEKTYNPLDNFCYGNTEVRARCGGMTYKTHEFCHDDKLYEKCGDKVFNPSRQFCEDNQVVERKTCNGEPYNEVDSFCYDYDRKIYDRCVSPFNINPDGEYIPLYDFCYHYDSGNKILERLCGGKAFNPLVGFCFTSGSDSTVHERCGSNNKEIYNSGTGTYSLSYDPNSGVYDPLGKFCYNEKIENKCGGDKYNTDMFFCFGGKIYEKCNNASFNILNFFCNGNKLEAYESCGTTKYNPLDTFCHDDRLYEKCNTEKYDADSSFCRNNILYRKCNGYPYNPSDQGCFEGKVYNLCKLGLEGDLGVCVHNTVLRCKQAGIGEKYIVRPYPGMECLDVPGHRGKIAGIIKHNGKTYNTVQIGEQVWMAENLDNGGKYLFYWGEACAGCLNDNNNTLSISYANRQGLCPNGWRVPSSNDWQELIRYAGDSIIAGNRLKSTTDWKKGYGLDNYGFNAKPLQFEANISSPLSNLNAEGAFWWTSTTLSLPDTAMAKFWYVISSDTEAEELAYEKKYFKFSIRCLQNIDR
jgi:uncharacterized protein (TIGR02145 family)